MNYRRDAIKRMGMGVLGMAGALSGAKAQQSAVPPSVGVGWATEPAAKDVGWHKFGPQDIAKRDPAAEARVKAADPLRQQMDELQGYQRWNIREYDQRNWDYGQRSYKSTSEWFRNSVAMDRAKERGSLLDKLRAEYESLLRSPLDKLSQEFQSAVAEALKEFS